MAALKAVTGVEQKNIQLFAIVKHFRLEVVYYTVQIIFFLRGPSPPFWLCNITWWTLQSRDIWGLQWAHRIALAVAGFRSLESPGKIMMNHEPLKLCEGQVDLSIATHFLFLRTKKIFPRKNWANIFRCNHAKLCGWGDNVKQTWHGDRYFFRWQLITLGLGIGQFWGRTIHPSITGGWRLPMGAGDVSEYVAEP